jgi:serine phosphatase RsbU (regulator of sigma subunit)
MVYLFSDGYADQFGGEKGKKFKYANLQKLLLKIAHQPIKVQSLQLLESFKEWRGELEQVDDVCIIGVKF